VAVLADAEQLRHSFLREPPRLPEMLESHFLGDQRIRPCRDPGASFYRQLPDDLIKGFHGLLLRCPLPEARDVGREPAIRDPDEIAIEATLILSNLVASDEHDGLLLQVECEGEAPHAVEPEPQFLHVREG